MGSDHRLILVKFGENNSVSKANKPFRFLSAWLTNEKFGKFVASHWKSNTTFSDMTHDHTPKLLTWNKVIFGNIFQRHRRLLARLGGIQRALEVKYTRSLCHLENKLKKEMEEVLNQEEWFWHKKSRKDWALLGDRNTKFFHQKTLAKRCRNCIRAIMDEKSFWLYELAAIKQHVIDFFSSLYINTDACFVSYPYRGYFRSIDESTWQFLMSPINDDEIKQTIFNMKLLKAPGVNGFLAIFYQSQWHVVGVSFCQMVKEVFNSHQLPADINHTLLVLIPKVDNPTSLKMFRSTSLCSIAYKAITKPIANRLKSILPDLIRPQQTSFVLGRHIIENIVVAQEVIHTMRKKTGRVGQMAIKVDLEKAYDRLSWDFIFETLVEVGLPMNLTRIIMECITTARMNVLWNGEFTEDFTPSRGIRQGDLISPYLFMLCIERLSHAICSAVNAGKWKPIRLSR